MSTKHTPGPWKATPYGIRDSGGFICATTWPPRYQGQEDRYAQEVAQREADAILIAAAPDLLEALEGLMEVERRGRLMPIGREWDAARAAIALAVEAPSDAAQSVALGEPKDDAAWDASQIKPPGWDHVFAAFVEGAREARANPDATEDDFRRAADGHTKRVFEEVDPVSEAALRTESWRVVAASASGAVGETAGKARAVLAMDPAADRERILAIAHRTASRYRHKGAPDVPPVYEFLPHHLMDFVEKVRRASLPGTSNGQENGNG